jgi:hypothetical protein
MFVAAAVCLYPEISRPRQFSLRALLVAVTVVALLLGAIVAVR